MIKNLFIAIASVGMITSLGAQEKFTTNQGAKTVTELNTELSDVQFQTVLPSSITKYDAIVSVIDYKNEFGKDYYTLNFYYNFMPTKSIPASRKLNLAVKTKDGSRSDFTSLYRNDMDVAFNLDIGKNDDARNYESRTVVVKVMGRYQVGVRWENGVQVPDYKYDELSYTEISMDLGAYSPTVTSKDGSVTFTKFEGNGTNPEWLNLDEGVKIIYKEAESDAINFYFDVLNEGEVKTQTVDMSGGPQNTNSSNQSNAEKIKTLKYNLKMNLIKYSNYKEVRSLKLQGVRFPYSSLTAMYEPFMMDNGKGVAGGTKGNALKTFKSIGKQFGAGGGANKYAKFLDNPESDLQWEKKSFGNWECEMLTLELYNTKQGNSSSSSETRKIKDGEQGKTQTVYIFVGELDGKVVHGLIDKDENAAFTTSEKEYVEKLMNGLSFN